MRKKAGSTFRFAPSARRSHFAVERDAPSKEEQAKIVFATEGDTERFYLMELAKVERVHFTMIPAESHGSDPLSVVNAAITQKDKEIAKNNWYADKDKAFAIFDGEEHRAQPGQEKRYYQAIDKANGNDITVILSNPSVEFWFWLNFAYSTAAMHRDAAEHSLKTHIPDYNKAATITSNYRQFLRFRTDTAIANAKRLRLYAKECSSHQFDNPCTHFDTLVCILLGRQ